MQLKNNYTNNSQGFAQDKVQCKFFTYKMIFKLHLKMCDCLLIT